MTIEERRRPRRVASDEAHSWARHLKLHHAGAKHVLSALSLYVNGEGCCYVGIDQLAEDTDMSANTVRRRLLWLDQDHVGAITRIPQYIDEYGKRNGVRGKRTTDLIRLNLHADPGEIERRALGDKDGGERDDEISPTNLGGLNPTDGEISPSNLQGLEPSVSPPVALQQPSSSPAVALPIVGGPNHLNHEPEPEESPNPKPLPPVGERAVGKSDDEVWQRFGRFKTNWQEPIFDLTAARREFERLPMADQEQAIAGAGTYIRECQRAKRKPKDAHRFLRDRLFTEFANLSAERVGAAVANYYPPDSAEAMAIKALHAIGRKTPREMNNGDLIFTRLMTPQIAALQWAPPRGDWIWIEDEQQIGAWRGFVTGLVHNCPQLTEQRNGKSGLLAPWPWPPKKDGSLYAGPENGENNNAA